MNPEELLPELEEAAQELGVKIRYEKGDFDGGYCILRTEKIIIVNKKLNESRKASVIAQALNEYGIENIYVKPVVRVYIDEEVLRAQKASEKTTVKIQLSGESETIHQENSTAEANQ
jgi:acetylglutamate kinase